MRKLVLVLSEIQRRLHRRVAAQTDELHLVGLANLTSICADFRGACPLIADIDELESINKLPVVDQRRRCPRQLSTVVGANSVGWSGSRGSVKDQYHASHLVKLYEIRALSTELLRAQEVTSTRSQCTTASGHIKSVEAPQPEVPVQKIVGLFLEAPVGTCNDQSVRTIGRPFCGSHCHGS